jgi:hypothetical protein
MGSSRNRNLISVALAAVLLLLLIIGGMVIVQRAGRTSDQSNGAGGANPAKPSLPPIKLGVILSDATMKRWGSKMVVKVAREGLFDKSFDLYPIVEPGTAAQGEIPELCRTYFNGRQPIECTDTARLRDLDVIAAPYVSVLTPEMAAAVETFVRDDGKGLMIRAWLGHEGPGLTPPVQALNGLKEGQFGWNPRDTNCEIVAGHPLLGDLSAHVGTQLLLEPNGGYGVHNGQVLVRVTDISKVSPRGDGVVTNRDDFVHAPLFVATLGKGRIVGCMFHGHKNDDAQTSDFVHTIMPRSIQWLAGRLP